MIQTTKEVSAQEARQWMDSRQAIVIDVREKAEYDAEHIPGAVLHPVSALDAAAIKNLAKGRRVVFQCASGKRAAGACEKFMAETGQDNDVYLLQGSLPGWKQAGFATEKSGGVLPLDQQVLVAAGSIVLTGALLSIIAAGWFVWLCAFAGAGMLYAGLSGNCMIKKVLMKMPWNNKAA